MQQLNFEETLERVVQSDPRYTRAAYHFVREALDHTQKLLGKTSGKAQARHVTGQELLEGIRSHALTQFGPMAMTVLEEWGVRTCEDFGEIVFNLVENSLLAKTQHDRREDFKGGYDFYDAFRKPFQPTPKVVEPQPAPAPQPTR